MFSVVFEIEVVLSVMEEVALSVIKAVVVVTVKKINSDMHLIKDILRINCVIYN